MKFLNTDKIFTTINLDENTINHCKRVGKLSHFLSNLNGFSSEFSDICELSGRYHDIGKADLEIKELLEIDRKFTSSERLLMRKHVFVGVEYLDNNIDLFLEYGLDTFELIRKGVMYHHEAFDGSGYNDLIGEEIPVIARVVTICDFFDALMEKRNYKESFSFEKTISIMKENSHIFDPKFFEIFLKNLENIENYYKKL